MRRALGGRLRLWWGILDQRAYAAANPSRWRWSPFVDACQCLTHEHGLVAVGETIRDPKRLDPVPIRHHFDGAGPVGAPQTALQAEGVEDTRQRIPQVGKGKGGVRQGAGTADFHRHVGIRR
jgi:hypothetical protein